MSVQVHLIEGPLGEPLPWRYEGKPGALVLFEGIVRPLEDGRALAALDYEAYEPMATRMTQRLAADLIARHGLLAICVEHSTGRVGVGDCSFRLRIASAHRKESLTAADEFIDRLKQDIPIWKQPVWIEPNDEAANLGDRS